MLIGQRNDQDRIVVPVRTDEVKYILEDYDWENGVYYEGRALSFSATTAQPIWQIKRVRQNGAVKETLYADNGRYSQIWDSRTSLFPSYTPFPGIVKTISATITTSSVVVVPANPARVGYHLYNNSANSAYVSHAATSNGSTPTYIIATFANYTFLPALKSECYTGPISAIRNSGTGTITVFEYQLRP